MVSDIAGYHGRIVVRPQEISNNRPEVDPAARMPGHER
jgi:acyl-CoA hydrolase